MDKSLPPFNVGDEVVCVTNEFKEDGLIKDDHYKVTGLFQCQKCKCWFVSVGILTDTTRTETKCCGIVYNQTYTSKTEYYFEYICFRRISPYQNSVSRSLAEQALKDTGDSKQDMKPEKVKEVLQ